MTSDGAALAAIVILLFPMGFFLMSSPAFLLVKLDIAEVAQLLRGVIWAYLFMVGIAGIIAAIVFAVTGHPVFVVGVGAIAAFAIIVRPLLLERWDTLLRARDAGEPCAVRRLRQLHWGTMVMNMIQLGAVVSSIPFLAGR
jgi:hypothetical protein